MILGTPVPKDDLEKWKAMLCASFAAEFDRIKHFSVHVRNTDVVGAFAESVVRRFVRQHVAPLRCMTGSLVWPGLPAANARQIDTMLVWPTSCVPLFEVDSFAIVPRDSCHGVLEIKSSTYGDAATNAQSLFNDLRPAFEHLDHAVPRTLAVFCRAHSAGKAAALHMGSAGAVLLDENDQPQPAEILKLVEFIVRVRNSAMSCSVRPASGVFASQPNGPTSTHNPGS